MSTYTLSEVMAATALREQLAQQPRYRDPRRPISAGTKVYSQADEDGILGEIFRRIGADERRFVEIGVEYGLENNSLALLLSGWTGTWVEGDRQHADAIESKFAAAIARGDLRLLARFVDRDNVGSLHDALAERLPLDLLSIDIDGNDFHVAPALIALRPRVIVVEYNARFGAAIDWVMPYDPGHRWNGSDYFGASLKAWGRLLNSLDYGLVSCNLPGTNAFFVRRDCIQGRFDAVDDVAEHFEPPRYFLLPAYQIGHPPDRRPDKPYL